ncbi:recombination-associated protein RdgC [Orbaceae bacterium ac157xtp]
MLWFRNAIVYELNQDNLLDLSLLQKAVDAKPFTPCGNTDSTRSGWISPYGEQSENPLLININGNILLRLKKETKILPSPVIKQALQDKIEKQEIALNRKLKKSEKLSLKDEVYIDLLPRAFSKFQFYWLWIDTNKRRVIVDSGSFKQAEEILATLRKEMGQLSLKPFETEQPLDKLLTKWVRESLNCPPLILGEEVELSDAVEEKTTVKCKNQDLTSNEIFVHIDAGKQVNKIKLYDEQGLSFVINRDCTLKRIKFDGAILDKNEDFMPEEKDRKLEADFILMAESLSNTIDNVISISKSIS